MKKLSSDVRKLAMSGPIARFSINYRCSVYKEFKTVANDANQYRPNFKRQMIYAGAMLAAILVAYMLTALFFGSPDPKPAAEHSSQASHQPSPAVKPWYKTQSPPPTMITTPDLPLFPEVEPEESRPKAKARAYEEALPKESYETPKLGAIARPGPVPARTEVAVLPVRPESLPETASLPRWRKFAVVAPPAGQKPMIAIVIDDMGVDKKRSALTIDMKAPLTLSFLTYATDLERQTERARANGHELMLHVAMEPGSRTIDPGPNALLTGLSDEELRRRLEWGFQRFSTYVGVNNHMGSKFTADERAMRIVIEGIKSRGLLFLDSRTSSHTVGAKLARQMGVPTAERNIFLDHENTIEAVNRQLKLVEKMARRTGSVIAIGHPRAATITALRGWLEDIEAKGFRLVPLTTIVAMKTSP